MDLTEVNVWIYATAAVIAGERHETKNGGYQFEVPKWKIRINKIINKYKKEMATIKQLKKGNTSQKVQNKMMAIREKSAMSLKQIDELENNVRMNKDKEDTANTVHISTKQTVRRWSK